MIRSRPVLFVGPIDTVVDTTHSRSRFRSRFRSCKISSGRLMRLVLSKSWEATILFIFSIISSCSTCRLACRKDWLVTPCAVSRSLSLPWSALLTTHAANTEKKTKGNPAVNNWCCFVFFFFFFLFISIDFGLAEFVIKQGSNSKELTIREQSSASSSSYKSTDRHHRIFPVIWFVVRRW